MHPPAGSQVSRVPAQRTPPPDQLAPPPPAPAPARPPRRLRTAVTVVAGVVALLLLGGGIAAFVLYNRATTPDRSAPDVVVANYLQAFLVDRNDAKADEFACQSDTDLGDLRLFREDLAARERRFGSTISASWESLDVQRQGDLATVQVDLIISTFVDGISLSDRQRWNFVTRLGSGWRVCEGKRAG
ncbi:hypothetical protein ABGB16_05250 [Micromonospora sp. B11E3]|uniref:hypothetical protein n=1 Tax=Micromonospora sp. B11E3 TaxID=3153562 RepID=UPI00325C5877